MSGPNSQRDVLMDSPSFTLSSLQIGELLDLLGSALMDMHDQRLTSSFNTATEKDYDALRQEIVLQATAPSEKREPAPLTACKNAEGSALPSATHAIPDFEGLIDNAAGASQSRELLDDKITRGAVEKVKRTPDISDCTS